MKVLFNFILLCSSFFIFTLESEAQSKVDTISIIKAKDLPDKNIEYRIENGKVLFSKEETLKLILNEIKRLEVEQLAKSDKWSSSNLKNKIADYQMSYDLLSSNPELTFENPWKNDSITHRDYNKLSKTHRTSIALNHTFYQMINSGSFNLIFNDKEVSKLLKLLETRRGEDFYSEIEIFKTDDNIKIWEYLIHSVIE